MKEKERQSDAIKKQTEDAMAFTYKSSNLSKLKIEPKLKQLQTEETKLFVRKKSI
jgi:hypothetical protein